MYGELNSVEQAKREVLESLISEKDQQKYPYEYGIFQYESGIHPDLIQCMANDRLGSVEGLPRETELKDRLNEAVCPICGASKPHRNLGYGGFVCDGCTIHFGDEKKFFIPSWVHWIRTRLYPAAGCRTAQYRSHYFA